MLAPSFTLLRVRGIRIGAHWSWLVVFGLISWSLARSVFPFAYPGLGDNTYLVMAVVSALIFFICILLHELGHAFRALKERMKITDITLWLFGGVARFEGTFPSAGAEFRIAAAGPLVSIVLVGLFAALTWVGGTTGLPLEVRGVCDYLARINLAVVVFNLVPALPLDGGRILRAWLWNRKGDFTKATVSAARIGKGFGYLLIAVGAVEFFGASLTGGIWLAIMGWFLLQAAQAEQNFAVVKQAFQDLTVRHLMTRDPAVVSSDTTVDRFLSQAQAGGHSTYPVVDDGVLKGAVSLRMATQMPAERRAGATVADLMVQPLVLDGAAPVVEVIDDLRIPGRALVVDGDRVSGIISIADVVKALEVRQAQSADRRQRKRRKLALVWATVAILLPIAATLYLPPVVIIAPAEPIDVSEDVTIDGVPVTELSGRYTLVAVQVIRPNAIRAAFSYFNSEVDLVPRASLLPEGISETEYLRRQETIFEESQQAAAAAAAEAAGLEVQLGGDGAEILEIVEGSPAEEAFEVDDVIVGVDGTTIRLVSDLIALTTVRPAGTEFNMTVERGSETVEVQVRSARLQGFNSTNTGIGIVTTTRDLDVKLPFEIEFRDRQIGGPSAGLIYALLIADLLDDADLARDREIAASGTVQLDGRVGPVGGLSEKLSAAETAGADIFLVPQNEVDDVSVSGREGGVTTLGVESLRDAVAVLTGRV